MTSWTPSVFLSLAVLHVRNNLFYGGLGSSVIVVFHSTCKRNFRRVVGRHVVEGNSNKNHDQVSPKVQGQRFNLSKIPASISAPRQPWY
ncbi:uncharacterized protein F5Z01DRAFT_662618 [Emericellopsis atlantica]|uniref:Uncharacterized protein n=1 Tax=Emericellopsis atlantica TaxID=2614577 RepID=A0A9P8CNF5_9HYPO|nr:uncharacterized protein F5Z01DRAFT_662618 [Emericellopsis atlantica]KAG9251671.1 hypothetical protein F5Z01DRAFT_662618 [Emericellopsis atlantica]